MELEEIRKIIKEDIIPEFEDFLESESAFFIYIRYDEERHICTTISPAPDDGVLEDVMDFTGKKIGEEIDDVPLLVIGCEKTKYSKISGDDDVVDINTMDSGVMMVAINVYDASGNAILFSLPDFEEKGHIDINPGFEAESDIPQYTKLGITTIVHRLLINCGILDEEEDDGESEVGDTTARKTPVFRFSRN